MLPTTQEYKISLMIGQDSFRTLEGVEVIPNPNYPDEPWYSTGGLAIVFKLKIKDKLYALKCFYTEANERQERLGLIATYLKQNPSPYFVDFTYLENELWVETANDEGQGYPVVLMEWVEGKTLDNYLEHICNQNNTPALKKLYFQFCNLAWWLQQQPIAHGDIKHDNLIVTPDGKLKLIDYDGVFVPALRGRKANEMGSPCYQHPKRDAYFFDKNLDDFSLLVLQITLLALQHQPKLFTEHYNGDGIILKDTDYQNLAQSPIKTILWQLPAVKIPLLLGQLQGNLNNLNAIDLMPLLQDMAWINWLVGGQKDDLVNKDSLFVQACTNLWDKNFTKAIEDFNYFVELNPNNEEAYLMRAETKYELKDYTGSINDCTKAIELNPEFKKAYHSRGVAKFWVKDYLGAIEDYSKAIEIKSGIRNNFYTLFARGITKMKLNDYLGAIEDYSKAIEIDPLFLKVYENRGKCKSKLNNYLEAIEDFFMVIALCSNSKYNYLYKEIGDCFYKLKNHQKSIENYLLYLDLKPNDIYTLTRIAINYEKKGDLENAFKNFQKASNLDPNNETIQRNFQIIEKKILEKKHIEENGK